MIRLPAVSKKVKEEIKSIPDKKDVQITVPATGFKGKIKGFWQSTICPHHLRKNWFVKVSFFEFEAKDCGSFKLSDLKIETCRASGNGGQHVNTTDSALRVIHLSAGTESSASEERSQTRNKALAILCLQEKLYLITEQRHAVEKESMWLDYYRLECGDAICIFKGLPPKEIQTAAILLFQSE